MTGSHFSWLCTCSEECFDWWLQCAVNALLHCMSVYSGIPERVMGPAPAGRSGGLGIVCCLLWISNGFKRGHGLLVNHLSRKWWSDVIERRLGITLKRNKQKQRTVCISFPLSLLTFQTLWVYVWLIMYGWVNDRNKWLLQQLSFHLKSPTALKVSVGKMAKLALSLTLFCFTLLMIQLVPEE